MSCDHPLSALLLGVNPENGKKVLKVLKNRDCVQYRPEHLLALPCGNCLGCREDRAKTWAIRCVHEASQHEKNCFITLTFNDEHLKKNGSLAKEDFVNFMKRLRKKYVPKCPYPKNTPERDEWLEKNGIRFYHCGEYGEQLGRPHHHACLFNFDFPIKSKENPDGKYLWKESEKGNLYRCDALDSLWSDPLTGKSMGYTSIGSVTFDSAAYVARYIIKKLNGELAPGHYQGRQPEYNTMSRRPGIAKKWFKTYTSTDIALAYRNGFIIMNGKTYKIPKYYDLNYEIIEPSLFEIVKETRVKKAKENPDNTPERRAVLKTIRHARNKMRKRKLDSK